MVTLSLLDCGNVSLLHAKNKLFSIERSAQGARGQSIRMLDMQRGWPPKTNIQIRWKICIEINHLKKFIFNAEGDLKSAIVQGGFLGVLTISIFII